MTTLVIDIGGTKISAARWSDGQLTHREVCATPTSAPEFEDCLGSFIFSTRDVDGVAVCATGFTDGAVIYAVNRTMISFWNGYPLRATLERLTSLPVVLVNDAQAAAWGEYRAQSSHADLMFVTLSTGVGAGLVLDGQLRHGPRGLAGHVGHTRSHVDALDGYQLCSCGQWGCLETVASGAALARQASKQLGRAVDAADVHALASAGDVPMLGLLQNAASAVATNLLQISTTLDIRRIVLGGSVGLAPLTMQLIDQAMQQAVPDLFKLDNQPARLGPDAGLIGVGYLFADRRAIPSQ